MSSFKKITTDVSNVIDKKTCACSALITAGADTATLELFDGIIGKILTIEIAVGGTLYTVGDLLTLVQSESGEKAIVQVSTVDAPGTGVITGVTLVSGGHGYVDEATYATTTNSVAGTGATIKVKSIEDVGVSFCKVSAVANTSMQVQDIEVDCPSVSARITGTSPRGYVYYE